MKLFDDMAFDEKLAHIERCRISGQEEIRKGSPSQLADIADHLDYWEPFLRDAVIALRKEVLAARAMRDDLEYLLLEDCWAANSCDKQIEAYDQTRKENMENGI